VRTWVSACLVVLAMAHVAPSHAANADNFSFTQLHRMTVSELESLLRSSGSMARDTQHRITIAHATAVGRNHFEEGLGLLGEMDTAQLGTDEYVYHNAARCLLEVRSGAETASRTTCKTLEDSAFERDVSSVTQAISAGALASFETRSGNLKAALEYFDTGLKAAVRANDSVLLARLHHNRSIPLVLLGMTDLAVRCIERARSYADSMPEDANLPTILNYNLGYLQAQRGQHDLALPEYYAAEIWTQDLGQTHRTFIINTQIAISLIALGRPQEAVDELSEWMEREDIQVADDANAEAHLVMGKAQLALGRTDVAESWFMRGLSIAEAANNPLRRYQLRLASVDVLLASSDPQSAADELQSLLLLETGNTKLRADVLERLATAYAELDNFETAWMYLSEHQEVSNETNSVAFDARLAALRTNNELSKMEYDVAFARANEQAAHLRAQNADGTRNLTIAAALLLAVIALAWYRRSIDQREARAHAEAGRRLERLVDERSHALEEEMVGRLRAERAKIELEKRVADDERLRTIGQLTGGVAHDFNNLLTVILISADLLKAGRTPDVDALIEDIVNAGESGKAITQSLLAYARQQDLQPENIDIAAFLQRNASLFQRTLGDGIALTIKPAPVQILADPGQLITSIINLLFNAREALGTKGQVSIEIEEAEDVRLIVTDDGPGMSDLVMNHATDPFFTTKHDGKGSGLGLSMVYGFVKQSGGDLRISNGAPNGTRVEMRFPVAEPAARIEVELPARVEDGIGTKRTALLVDDQAAVRTVCSEALIDMGFTVTECEDGQRALAALETNERFDVVITDAVMPGGVLGMDVADAVANNGSNIPVLLISGGALNVPDHCAYLAKPFTLQQFREAVHGTMQREGSTVKTSVAG